jgi:cytochrome P450
MSFPIIAGFTLLLSSVLWFFLNSMKKSSKSHPLLISIPRIPVIGNVLDFAPENIIKTMVEFPKKYGKFIEFYFFSQRGLLITDIEVAKEVLMKRPKKFRRSSALTYSDEIMGTNKGVFSAEGAMWVKMRKSTSPSFSNLNISHKYASMSKEILLWIDSLLKKSVQSHVEMKKESFNLTIRIITIVAFGLDVHDPLCSYFFNEFSSDIMAIFRFMGDSVLFPFPRFLWRFFPQYQSEVTGSAADARLTIACQKIIDYKRSLVKEGKLPMNCMIDSLISNTAEGTDKALTDEEIIANIKVFFIAGSDTTAVTLSWMIYYFALYPNILKKIQEETKPLLFPEGNVPTLTEFIQNDTLTASFTMNQFKELKYTNAFFKETLRLNTPAGFIFLETVPEEGVSLNNGIELGPKELVIVNVDGLNVDPEVFDSSEQFNPDRWLTDDKEKLNKMESSFIPFGGGPRICPGMNLALNEALVSVSLLSLYSSVALACPKEEIQKISTFVTVPNKMPVKFSPL